MTDIAIFINGCDDHTKLVIPRPDNPTMAFLGYLEAKSNVCSEHQCQPTLKVYETRCEVCKGTGVRPDDEWVRCWDCEDGWT